VIDRYPVYSPDGRRLAFASNRLGPEQLWIMDLSTRRSERIDLPGRDVGVNLPTWTGDGRRLLLTRSFPDGTQAMWITAADGSEAKEFLKAKTGSSGQALSPDGKSLAYAARVGGVQQLYGLELATGRSRQITSSPGDKFNPTWSPDGGRIAYSSNATGVMEVWAISPDGQSEKQLTSGFERMYHPFYSPDSRWLYVQPSHRNVYRMPAGGGPLEPVTRFPESGLFLEEPTMSPDGRFLAYSRSNGGASLWLLTMDDGRPKSR
jgi:TolB protein